MLLASSFALASNGSFQKQSKEHKELVYSSLNHPTSILLRSLTSGSDYLHAQQKLISEVMAKKDEEIVLFGKTLEQKEKASLFHQYDLFTAYLESPDLKESLDKLGFNSEAYLRGSFDSDLGKLKSYQELFTEKSAKSDLLFLFLQGKGPHKSIQELHRALEEMNETALPFLNPDLETKYLREVFKRYPILKGFLHELPGMIDAVIAFELGIISAKEFREQLHVNLFHCGPSAGYWKRFHEVFLPSSFKKNGDEELLEKLFKGSLYIKEHSDHLSYGPPSTFESFISTLFDRLSQGTSGGYKKIDWEIGGNSIANTSNLLLKTNIPWTLEQLQLLKEEAQAAHLLSEKQKTLIITLIDKSITYLNNYQSIISSHLHYEEKEGWQRLNLKINEKEHTFTYVKNIDSYFSNGQILGREQLRQHLHRELDTLFDLINEKHGSPFQGLKWP